MSRQGSMKCFYFFPIFHLLWYSNKLHLCPLVPPVIRSEIQEYQAPVDSAMMLHCHAEGTPPPSVTWHKDGQLLSDSVRQRLLSSGSLQITLIQPTDSGRYTCTAANAAGTATLDMSLTVQSRFQYRHS